MIKDIRPCVGEIVGDGLILSTLDDSTAAPSPFPSASSSMLGWSTSATHSPGRHGCRAGARAVAILMTFVLFALGAPVEAQETDLVKPGETLEIVVAPEIGGGCKDDPFLVGSICLPLSINPQDPLRGSVTAILPFRRAEGVFLQFNDFEVDGGRRPETLLAAHFSGAVDIKGFLALVGAGEVTAQVVAKVLDITEDPENGAVIKTHAVAKYELRGRLSPNLSVGLKAQGGAPFIGVSGGPNVGMGTNAVKRLVRDEVVFDFDAPIRRGHLYRLQLELQVAARCFAVCGLAVAKFFALVDAVTPPNLLDPEQWSTQLGLDAVALPSLRLDNSGFRIFDRAVSKVCDTVNPDNDDDSDNDTCDTSDVLRFFGMPTSAGDVVDRIVEKMGFGENGVFQEALEFPGVEVISLRVSIEEDEMEAIEEAFMEDKLLDCDRAVRLILPAEFGGQLERVHALVDDLIDRSWLAGFRTERALRFLAEARENLLSRDFNRSYKNACKAYRHIAKADDD